MTKPNINNVKRVLNTIVAAESNNINTHELMSVSCFRNYQVFHDQ